MTGDVCNTVVKCVLE